MIAVTNVQALVRRTHEEHVLAVLRERAGLSRAEIATRVGLSRTTLSEITGDLLSRGAIVVVDTDASTRSGSGRRAELLALDPRSGQYLGVDLAHTRVRLLVADAAHEVIASGVRSYDASLPWSERIAQAIELAESVALEQDLHFGALQGVAVGVAGTDATAREAAHHAFAEHFGVQVLVDNNTRYAALAEAMTRSSTDGAPSELVYLRLSEGVGGGLVVAGRLVSGGLGAAGELGHVQVTDGDDARACRCGRAGCLETVASTRALREAADERGLEAALATAADAVASVLTTAALILSPERIVVGGTVVAEHPGLLDAVRRDVTAAFAGVGAVPPVVTAAVLGDDDGARGAIAALVQRSPLLAGYPALSESDDTSEPRSLRA
ncbi:ROK family transcriptional regulator [Nocardioides oleivorans]|uniref:ROK family transcriptional regulator n=1 Tax=Nocardioides oleivorans TaxID=273676 RepID=UPI001F5D7D3F|nr:ROK family transcriptional regulator [Nocardioides oleivorans]